MPPIASSTWACLCRDIGIHSTNESSRISIDASRVGFSRDLSAPSAAGQSLTLPAVVGRPLAIPAGAPWTFSYYTTHARLRMAERDISKAEVVSGVKDACRNSNVYYQWWDGTYKYESGFLGVIMNRQGGVITVYWRTSGGGWSQPVDQLH